MCRAVRCQFPAVKHSPSVARGADGSRDRLRLLYRQAEMKCACLLRAVGVFNTVMTVNNTLGPAPVRGEARGDVMSAERARALEDLQRRSNPPTSAEVGRSLDLHTNTARLHLEALVARGLAERFSSHPQGRGRPALRYRAVPQLSEPDRRVRGLGGFAGALSAHIQRTSSDPVATARFIGADWAQSFDSASSPVTSETGNPVEVAVERLDQFGFEAHLAHVAGGKSTYRLHRCPLLDVAKGNPDVVCDVHLGLVRGTLTQLGADHVRADLEPFAEPGACVLTFDTADI